jgi:hypothetical protein
MEKGDRSAYRIAKTMGVNYLKKETELFQYAIDVKIARDNKILPLP